MREENFDFFVGGAFLSLKILSQNITFTRYIVENIFKVSDSVTKFIIHHTARILIFHLKRLQSVIVAMNSSHVLHSFLRMNFVFFYYSKCSQKCSFHHS